MAGSIIFLDGASSSGKSTLARTLQARLALPFWHYSIDHLAAAGVLPRPRIDSGEFAWGGLRAAFFDGFHRSLPALAAAGNNLIVEHIVETADCMERLLRLLASHDVFFVLLQCPLPELERRERERGDRPRGDARRDCALTGSFGCYDFEVDSTAPPERNAEALATAWAARTRPSAFERMAHRQSSP